jgi:hypothetical protein
MFPMNNNMAVGSISYTVLITDHARNKRMQFMPNNIGVLDKIETVTMYKFTDSTTNTRH